MILLYSTLIYICKTKQLNYTKFISNDSTAVHFLGHGEKSAIFSVNVKIRRKRGNKNAQKHKNREIFYHF